MYIVFFYFILFLGEVWPSFGVFWRSFGRKQDFGSFWSIVGNPILEAPLYLDFARYKGRGGLGGSHRWSGGMKGNRTVASGNICQVGSW